MAEEKTFEQKLKEVEIIVNELESGDSDLDASIEKYTKAMNLIKECDNELKNIEEKIAKIVNNDGTLEEFKTEN